MSVTTLLTEGWRYGRPQASVTVGWAERNESGQVMERYTGLVKGWGGEFLTTADGELCAGRWAGMKTWIAEPTEATRTKMRNSTLARERY